MMVPEFMPIKRGLVYFTGILEPLLGLVLLVPAWRRVAGVALIVLLLIMLPANIYAAMRRVNYETAAFDGKGPAYLWFRVPMQIFLIEWIVYFSVWEMN